MRLSFAMEPDRKVQDRQRNERPFNRRAFLRSGITFSGAALTGVGLLHGTEIEKKSEEKEAEVGPPEDLMREHGVLKRVLLIYGEVLRRIDAKQDFPPEALADAAGIIRSFVEDYHEKLEEDFLFPRFEKANQLVDLVRVLREQHQAGRRVTDITMRFANLQSLKNESERAQLVDSTRQFIRMYNPHEAREDTVLFPAFRKIVSTHEFDSLGEDFEKKEDELFGDAGFEKVVDKVAGIEKRLGIYDRSCAVHAKNLALRRQFWCGLSILIAISRWCKSARILQVERTQCRLETIAKSSDALFDTWPQ